MLPLILQKLYLQYQGQSAKSKVDVYKATPMSFPYEHNGCTLFFVSESFSSEVLSLKAKKALHHDGNCMVMCPVPECGKQFPHHDSCHHAAWHVLHDKILEAKVGIRANTFCSTCSANPAMTYVSNGDVCIRPVWFEKNGTTFVPHIRSKVTLYSKFGCKCRSNFYAKALSIDKTGSLRTYSQGFQCQIHCFITIA